jgi:hypothetical protein
LDHESRTRKLQNFITVALDKFKKCLAKKWLFVYHGQRVHVFRPSLSFLAEAQPRLEKQARTKGTFWQSCTLNFLGDHMNYKAKDIIGNIYLDLSFSNTYISTIFL